MMLTWSEVFKLTFPFVTAILLVWIKSGIESRIARRNKQHALSRLLNDEIGQIKKLVDALGRIAESASRRKLRLVTMDLSSLIVSLSSSLSDLDSSNAYYYSDLASWYEIVNKGFVRLSTFLTSRAGSSDSTARENLDRAIMGQAKIVASDAVSFAKAGFLLLDKLPRNVRYQDSQAMASLEKVMDDAIKAIKNWQEYELQTEDGKVPPNVETNGVGVSAPQRRKK
jgi:hypothetical protein